MKAHFSKSLHTSYFSYLQEIIEAGWGCARIGSCDEIVALEHCEHCHFGTLQNSKVVTLKHWKIVTFLKMLEAGCARIGWCGIAIAIAIVTLSLCKIVKL